MRRPRGVAIIVITATLLAACGGDLGSRTELDATVAEARAVLDQTLMEIGVRAVPRMRISGTRCESPQLVALSGGVDIEVDSVEAGVDTLVAIRAVWSRLPEAQEFSYREPTEQIPSYASVFEVNGGADRSGGYNLFVAFVLDTDSVGLAVNTGCYRDE